MNDPNQQYYGGQPGYPPNPGYPQGGYPQGGYPQPGGYPPPGGYPQPGGYPDQGGYPGGAPGYAPQPGFVNPPQGVPYGQVPGSGPGYGTNYNDPESDDVKGFDFTDQTIRRGFIRKVYSILMAQLLVTFGVIALFVFHQGTRLWVQRHPEMVFVALAVMLVTMIAMACCGNVRRKAPMNFIFLALFTLAESFLLATSAARFRSDEVLIAVGITAAVCLGLTLFAFQTKWDFTVLSGVLFVALLIFVIFGIVAIFLPGKTMTLVYSSLGALLFSFYLVYDTQLMLGGKHKYSITPEEYIFAALNIYLDVVQIFIHILAIIGATRD